MVNKVDNYHLPFTIYQLLWAVVPPLLLLAYYYRRVLPRPPLLHLLLCFGVGALSGFVALSLEWGFEHLANQLVNWDRITRSLAGVALRQVVEVGAIEEGCKLGGVVLFLYSDRIVNSHRHHTASHPTTIFMLTIAIALGFTAQENWVYLSNDMASVSDRAIGTLVHALFSAPWGYALATNRRLIATWVNAVICHALVNIFSTSPRYPPPLLFLSYGLFPFLLWMCWRLEGLLRRVQRKPPIILISGLTPIHRYWQLGLVLFALMLGGNALLGFFLLARSLSPLSLSQLFYPNVLWFILSRSLTNLMPGLLAWGIYKYLRYSASRMYR
jgi:RsiW-degrading membrane proteinase PrsW (M82 family)